MASYGFALNPQAWGAAGDGVTDDTAIIQDLTATGMPINFQLSAPGKCYLVSSSITIYPGQDISGMGNNISHGVGGICVKTPGFNVFTFSNAAYPLNSEGAHIHDLDISYTGPQASGAAVTWSTYGGVASSPAITAAGTNYYSTPGFGVNGCHDVRGIVTWSSGGLSTITPATGSVGDGTFVASNYTGGCPPWSPNAWSAGTYAAGYSVVDSNGNVELVTVGGTTGGSAPTWSITLPLYPGSGYGVGGNGGNTIDGTVTWANMGPNQGWAATTAYVKGHLIIVPISGTNYLFVVTTAGTTAGTQSGYSATLGSSVTDGTAHLQNAGVFGYSSVFGGTNGDPTNAAAVGYAFAMSASVFGVTNLIHVDHINVAGMGVLYANGMGNSLFEQVHSQTSDGNGYAYYIFGTGLNDNKFISDSAGSVGPLVFAGSSVPYQGFYWNGGDMLGGFEKTGEIASGGSFELKNMAGSLSLGDSESIGEEEIICNGSNLSISDSGFTSATAENTGDFFGFWPVIVAPTGCTLNIDKATVLRAGFDYGVPLALGINSGDTITGNGQFKGSSGDTGINQAVNSVGSITAIPATAHGYFATVPSGCLTRGLDPVWGLNTTGQDLLWATGQTATGVCATADLFAPAQALSNGVPLKTAVVNQASLTLNHTAVDTVATPMAYAECTNNSASNYCIPGWDYQDSALLGAPIRNFYGPTLTLEFGINVNGVQDNIPINPNLPNTSVSCSTSGTAKFSMPLQGTTDKKVMIYLSACLGTASYTFPTAFGGTPGIFASSTVASTVASSVSTTAVTITGTTSTGFMVLEGY